MKTIKVHYIELAFVLANDAIINGDIDGSVHGPPPIGWGKVGRKGSLSF